MVEKLKTRLQRIRANLRQALPFVSGVFATLIALLLFNQLTPDPQLLTEHDVATAVAEAMASATAPPSNASLVYQVIQPSLVLIQINMVAGDGGIAENSGDGLVQDEEENIATGVIIDDMGSILTSLHVVANANTILVTFADGTQSNAEIVGAMPENDIAVLMAEQPPMLILPATLGSPDSMRVGDPAYIVGHPFGLYRSMTAGVVSGFNRTYQVPRTNLRLENLIQVDAAANPGNSGGPLLNRAGHVVGIVTAILNPTGQEVFVGISFAVPITVAGGGAGLPPY